LLLVLFDRAAGDALVATVDAPSVRGVGDLDGARLA